MKYRCLVLDHDDTAVNSTPAIHYPSFIEAMKEMRPLVKSYTLEEFVKYCFDPGFNSLCMDILKYSEVEIKRQQEIWHRYTKECIPKFYDGLSDIINEFKSQGGYVCVVSHSESRNIFRDYNTNLGMEPDLVFGWEYEEYQRKPNPYPLEEIMRKLDIDKEELIVVDDLKPGLDMARSCEVDFACAGWSHIVPDIKRYMMEKSDYYFSEVRELHNFIFS